MFFVFLLPEASLLEVFVLMLSESLLLEVLDFRVLDPRVATLYG